DVLGLDRFAEGRFIDKAAAAGVDEVGSGLHRGEELLAEELVGARRGWQMDRDRIAARGEGEELGCGLAAELAVEGLGVLGRDAAGPGDDVHAEGGGPLDDFLPDGADADDAQGEALEAAGLAEALLVPLALLE